MAFNDSLSDMLARIKNAHQAKKSFTSCFKSKLNMNVLAVLKNEGYIRDYKDIEIIHPLVPIYFTTLKNGIYAQSLNWINGEPSIPNEIGIS